MKKYGAMAAHSRIFLNFTWHVLSEQFRNNIPENTIKKKLFIYSTPFIGKIYSDFRNRSFK